MAIFDRVKKTKKATTEAAPKKEKAAKKVATEKATGTSAVNLNVIFKPLVTEKAAGMTQAGKYSFVVAKNTTKTAIKHAVESMYKVTVKNINVINVQGRVVRFGQNAGKRSDFKKAIVTLAPGQTITVQEGV